MHNKPKPRTSYLNKRNPTPNSLEFNLTQDLFIPPRRRRAGIRTGMRVKASGTVFARPPRYPAKWTLCPRGEFPAIHRQVTCFQRQ